MSAYATSPKVVTILDDDDDIEDEAFFDIALAKVRELENAREEEVKRKREDNGDCGDLHARRATQTTATTTAMRTTITTVPTPTSKILSSGGSSARGTERSNVQDFIEYLQTRPQCVATTWTQRRGEDCKTPSGFAMDPTLGAVLARCGVTKLYSHQSAAIKAARAGRSVVVSTPTASGKSMCYVIPIFEALMDEKSKQSKALLMFPLKALANDQMKKMRHIVEQAQKLKTEIDEMKISAEQYAGIDVNRLQRLASVKLAVCDGDTDVEVKAELKKQGTQIILTNPDSLHHAMLPAHRSWGKKFWGCLKYIVLDEAHTHTGVSGSHVANVLRRLLRVCASWNTAVRPEFICTSATISNPVAHVRRLTTRTPVCVDNSGAPSGEKAFLLWQPPKVDAVGGPERRSPYAEAADIVANLVQRNIRCLVFVSSRTSAETLARDAKRVLGKLSGGMGMELAKRVDCYRAGYQQAERRELESRLQRGAINALVCTSALEMGIDVGSLDATVHVGVPETASAMWQQAGRAGRRQGASVAVVIANEKPLDHYYCTRPNELFARQSEEALVDPYNSAILELHLPCAAKEVALDLRGNDAVLFTASQDDSPMRSDGARLSANFKAPLHIAIKRALGTASSTRTCLFNKATKTIECLPTTYPHRSVMLRGVQGGEPWKLIDTAGKLIEEVAGYRAMARLYAGCVFIARRGQFLIHRLEHEKRVAHASSYEKLETTATRERTDVTAMEPDPDQGVPDILKKRVTDVRVCLGDVHVSETVLGFVVNDHRTAKTIREELWRTPVVAAEYRTRAVWFDLPEECVRRVAVESLREATIGVANMCGGLVSSIAMCDSNDVAASTYLPNALSGHASARVFLYDTTPGGIGLAETIFDNIEELWRRALKAIEPCQCAQGCPSCNQAGRRGREAGFKKSDAKTVLDGLLGTWLHY